MAAREGAIDLLFHLQNLRDQRPNMVDNAEQYKLVHLVLLDCLMAPKTNFQCDSTLNAVVQNVIKNELQNQLDYLENSMWQDQAMRPCPEESNTNNFPHKNRFQNIVPGKKVIKI